MKVRGEILVLSKKNNYDDLTFHFKGKNIGNKSFKNFDDAFSFFAKIKKYNIIILENAYKIKMNLNQI